MISLRSDVAELANMACDLDSLKNRFPDLGICESLSRAVDDLHTAALHFDKLHSFGIYAEPDEVAKFE